ncbi:branched-chain amino acid transport system II carrier protein [Cytobacillus oceanisediminis]|nr:branched-chain amino acid transport system II carrier protein [Cytobacillus oceanisediminis]
MDAVAALAFGIVIINGLKDKGVTKKKDIIHGTIYAGLIAAGGIIMFIYPLAGLDEYCRITSRLKMELKY